MSDTLVMWFGVAAGCLALAVAFAVVNGGLQMLGEGRLGGLADEGGPVGREAERVLRLGRQVQTRILVARVICVAAAATSMAVALTPVGLLWVFLGVGAVTLIYGLAVELAGRQAAYRPRVSLRLLRLLRPFEWLFAAPAWPVSAVGAMVERLFPPARESAPELETKAVEHLIAQGAERGAIDTEQAALMRNLMEFKDTVAREVMVPRTRVAAFSLDTPICEVRDTIVESGHSRYPIYEGGIDDVVGVLYAKDLFRVNVERDDPRTLRDPSLEVLLRKPAHTVHEDAHIQVVLREMQAKRFHLAVVVDEFGGMAGVITLEDILEEIVGEIEDEHDPFRRLVSEAAPGHFIADATMSVYDLWTFLGEDNDDDALEGEFDSIGGMVMELIGGVPERGARVAAGPFDLIVLDADERHVTRVEIVRRDPATASAAQ